MFELLILALAAFMLLGVVVPIIASRVILGEAAFADAVRAAKRLVGGR